MNPDTRNPINPETFKACYVPSNREILEWLRSEGAGRLTAIVIAIIFLMACDSVLMRNRVAAIIDGGFYHPSYDYIRGR